MPKFRFKIPCAEAFTYYDVLAESEEKALIALKNGEGTHQYDSALDEQRDDAECEGEIDS